MGGLQKNGPSATSLPCRATARVPPSHDSHTRPQGSNTQQNWFQARRPPLGCASQHVGEVDDLSEPSPGLMPAMPWAALADGQALGCPTRRHAWVQERATLQPHKGRQPARDGPDIQAEQSGPKPRPWARAQPHDQVIGSQLRNTPQRTQELPVSTQPPTVLHTRALAASSAHASVLLHDNQPHIVRQKGKRTSAYERRKTSAPGSAPLRSPATAQQTVRQRQQRNAEPDYQMTLELGKHQSCRACAIRAISPTHVHDKGRPH